MIQGKSIAAFKGQKCMHMPLVHALHNNMSCDTPVQPFPFKEPHGSVVRPQVLLRPLPEIMDLNRT